MENTNQGYLTSLKTLTSHKRWHLIWQSQKGHKYMIKFLLKLWGNVPKVQWLKFREGRFHVCHVLICIHVLVPKLLNKWLNEGTNGTFQDLILGCNGCQSLTKCLVCKCLTNVFLIYYLLTWSLFRRANCVSENCVGIKQWGKRG